MSIRRHFGFPLLFVVTFLPVLAGSAFADTIVFQSGIVWKGKIHKENFYFPDRRNDPNLIEFEKLEGNTIYCYGLDLATQGSLIKEIIYDDYEFPMGTTPDERLTKARENYAKELAMRAALATPTPSAEVELTVEVISAKGWVLRNDGGQDVKLVGGLKIPIGSMLRTRMNSRLKCTIGEALVIGMEQDTQLSLEKAVWDQVHKLYHVSMPLKRGTLWIEKKPAAHEINRAEILSGPLRILAANTISRITADGSGSFRVAVYETESFSLHWKEKEITVGVGQEVSLDANGNVSGSQSVSREHWQNWKNWDTWEPLEITLNIPFSPPSLVPAPLADFQFALPSLGVADRGFAGTEPRAMTLADTLDAYRQGIESYAKDTGSYPSEKAGLNALREDPGVSKWRGPYVSLSLGALDPWDNPFIYKLRKIADGQEKPDVYSTGPNGRDDDRLGDDVY